MPIKEFMNQSVRTGLKCVEVEPSEFMLNIEQFEYSLFNTVQWLSAIEKHNEIPVYFDIYNEDEVVAKASGLVIHGGWRIGRQLFLYSAIALKKELVFLKQESLQASIVAAKAKKYSRLFFRSFDQQYDFDYPENLINSFERWEYNLDLTNPECKPTKSFLYNARKAAKIDASFHMETSERVYKRLIELLSGTSSFRTAYSGDGYEAFPYHGLDEKSLKKLIEEKVVKLYHVEVDGEIHSVRCSMEIGNRVYGLMMAGDPFAYKNGLQHFLQLEVLNVYLAKGMTDFNLSGAIRGNGLAKFKESLGCKERRVSGGYSIYLISPYTLINTINQLLKRMGGNKFVNSFKKMAVKLVTGSVEM